MTKQIFRSKDTNVCCVVKAGFDQNPTQNLAAKTNVSCTSYWNSLLNCKSVMQRCCSMYMIWCDAEVLPLPDADSTIQTSQQLEQNYTYS